ncbi:hypothetical protein Q31a_35860 [Aureliella helgolandensis]|uniref:Uncharacterized protein n=1 Tax=Aureliella helgolandensis TaxID=2527968 RepID=A0A518G9L3_9BACT|nr:hypothetical protein Q31a_35860 [Aureliella helgolandensis]
MVEGSQEQGNLSPVHDDVANDVGIEIVKSRCCEARNHPSSYHVQRGTSAVTLLGAFVVQVLVQALTGILIMVPRQVRAITYCCASDYEDGSFHPATPPLSRLQSIVALRELLNFGTEGLANQIGPDGKVERAWCVYSLVRSTGICTLSVIAPVAEQFCAVSPS